MYNGEFNAKKLDNWIRQLEVYCRIENLQDDDMKIQLASLRMEGSTCWVVLYSFHVVNRGFEGYP